MGSRSQGRPQDRDFRQEFQAPIVSLTCFSKSADFGPIEQTSLHDVSTGMIARLAQLQYCVHFVLKACRFRPLGTRVNKTEFGIGVDQTIRNHVNKVIILTIVVCAHP